MGRGDYHISAPEPAERAFLRRPQRQLVVARQRELRAADRCSATSISSAQRHAHLQPAAGQRSHVLLPHVEVGRRRGHADRAARSGRQRRRRERRPRHELHASRASINLNYPGVNAQDYDELAVQGHDDLQRRQPHAEVGLRVHPAGLRVQPGADPLGELHRHAHRQRDRRLHDRRLRHTRRSSSASPTTARRR